MNLSQYLDFPSPSTSYVTLPQYLTSTPAVLFTFDDASYGVYTNGYSYMRKFNARGTFYIYTNLARPGTTNYLLEMEASGWSIANHTRTHPNLTTLSQADAQTEIWNGRSDLAAWGHSTAIDHLAYPQSQYNATVIAAAQAVGVLSARAGWVGTGGLALNPWTLQYEWVHAGSVDVTYTLDYMKGLIDGAIAGNKTVTLLFHGIPTSITIANFRALVDYIVANSVPFITIEDVWNSLSGSIQVPVAS